MKTPPVRRRGRPRRDHRRGVIRGGVSIEKRDEESQLLTPLGAASLDGCVFAITNKSAHAVVVDGTLYAPGDVCKTVIVENGVASTQETALPRGSYAIQEISAGEGYLPPTSNRTCSPSSKNGAVISLDTGGSHDDAALRPGETR